MKKIVSYCTLLLLTAFVSVTGCAPSNKMGTPNNQKSNLRKTTYQDGASIKNTQNVPNARNKQMNQPNSTNQDFRLADHIVKKVTKIKEVKTASAVVNGNKAYVAVTLKGKNENAKLNKAVEKEIMGQVKSADSHVKHVYVSAHPDFVQRINHYTNQVRTGHPFKHLTNDLYKTIQYIFPHAR